MNEEMKQKMIEIINKEIADYIGWVDKYDPNFEMQSTIENRSKILGMIELFAALSGESYHITRNGVERA